MGGGDGLEEVESCVSNGVVAMDIQELTAGVVEAVEGHIIGIDRW